MNIAVYLGSSGGNAPEYAALARDFGAWIGKAGHSLIYGGTATGLMGELASSALENGAKVTGVLPDVPVIMARRHPGLTECICTASVAERRSRMIELADGFVALPGGLGTVDEISEVMSLASLKILAQPIVLLGANGYYEPVKAWLKHMIDAGFSRPEYYFNTLITESIAEAGSFLTLHNPSIKQH